MADDLQIRAEPTPNPNSLKFAMNRVVWEGRAQTFTDPAQAIAAPLARALLNVPGVASVFFLRDFVTVNRQPGAAWEPIATDVERILREHLASAS